MKLSDLGEGGLLDLIRDWTAGPARGVALGLGDDAAILDLPGSDRQLVISTDAWVEGVHFSRQWLAPDEIGHRAMAGTLSDLAAMGADAIAAFVNLYAPSDLDVSFLRSVYQGMDRIADSCGASIAGGDTVRGAFALGITAVGSVPVGQAIRRDGANVGDVICVSGELGKSEAGRRLLTGWVGGQVPDRLRAVAEAGHRTPRPRFDVSELLMSLERRTVDIDLKREIVEPVRPTAMIDVSDGLAIDLRRLCEASGVGCRLDEARIPVDGAARRVARFSGARDCAFALAGGEDFELLFTLDPAHVEILLDAAHGAGMPVSPMGAVVAAADGMSLADEDGAETPLPNVGWDHFSSTSFLGSGGSGGQTPGGPGR